MPITNIQTSTGEKILCQAGASEKRAVLTITFCNTTAVDHTVTMYAYATGGTAGDGTTVFKTLTVPALDTYSWEKNNGYVLMNSDVISAISDAASCITATVNYYVFV